MPEPAHFDWIPFYTELAHTLLDYKADRTELVAKILAIYEKAGIKMPTLDEDGQLVDMDPFTFFGLFNKQISDTNRIKIITAIAKLFNISAPVPTSFDGLPTLNNLNATYYEFRPNRSEQDIPDLWNLFEAALDYAEKPTEENRRYFSQNFDIVINKKSLGNSKVTMGLFWIAPDTFLNFDSRNVWYIYETDKIPESVLQILHQSRSSMRD